MVNFNANGEALAGDIVVDSISSVTLNLAKDNQEVPVGTTLTGTINAAATSGTVNLNIDAASSWVLTGNSNLTTLTGAGTGNISCCSQGQCTLTVGSGAPVTY
jgi:hypothetical protein